MRTPLLLCLAAVALGCQPPVDPPETVAERFWTAIQADDWETARAEATPASADGVGGIDSDRPIEQVLIGETLRSETSAVVRTTVVTRRDEGAVHATFDTHLAWNGEAWRVEVDATRRDWAAATFSASMRLLGEAMGTGLVELSEAFQEGAAELMQSINEAIEDAEAQRSPPGP